MTHYDIASFARFLTEQKCVEVLLFYKDVEQFKSVFGDDEKNIMYKKIYDMYCKHGAPRQVNFKGNVLGEIEKVDKKDIPEEIFDKAQAEVHSQMRLDLFPAFKEAIEKNKQVPGETPAQSIHQVTSGTNPGATRSFLRFAREQMCEESLLFWIEANDYGLLFMPSDRHMTANEIYTTFMGASASFKVGVKNSEVSRIKACIDEGEKACTSALFLEAQTQVIYQLEHDIFPRYEQWLKDSPPPPRMEELKRTKSSRTMNDKDQNRAAMKEILAKPAKNGVEDDELIMLRVVAQDRNSEENLDFYLECAEYQLLFSATDRIEKATAIWNKFIDDSSDRMINIPDHIREDLQKKILTDKKVEDSLFNLAMKDVLSLMTDNFYPEYIKRHGADDVVPTTDVATKAPPPKSGGCCVLM